MVRGYYVYETIWTAVVGEEFPVCESLATGLLWQRRETKLQSVTSRGRLQCQQPSHKSKSTGWLEGKTAVYSPLRFPQPSPSTRSTWYVSPPHGVLWERTAVSIPNCLAVLVLYLYMQAPLIVTTLFLCPPIDYIYSLIWLKFVHESSAWWWNFTSMTLNRNGKEWD